MGDRVLVRCVKGPVVIGHRMLTAGESCRAPAAVAKQLVRERPGVVEVVEGVWTTKAATTHETHGSAGTGGDASGQEATVEVQAAGIAGTLRSREPRRRERRSRERESGRGAKDDER